MRIAVAIITWPKTKERIKYFEQTVRALRKIVCGPSDDLTFLVSAEFEGITPELSGAFRWSCECLGISSFFYHPAPASIGGNYNFALQLCVDRFDFVLLMQDDWLLVEALDISAACRFLKKHPEFSIIRFGWSEFRCHSAWRLDDPSIQPFRELDASSVYLYADEPHLRRGDSLETLGHYVEGGTMGSAEFHLNGRAKNNGWRIVTSQCRMFEHCGGESTHANHFEIRSPEVDPNALKELIK